MLLPALALRLIYDAFSARLAAPWFPVPSEKGRRPPRPCRKLRIGFPGSPAHAAARRHISC